MTTAETWHGTPSGYRCKGCRCNACSAAHADRQAYWYRLKGYGNWTPFVDAEPVREHISMLREYGIGVLRVTTLSGVGPSVIQRVVYPCDGRPPQRRIREDLARKVLAVRPSFDLLADGASVPSTGTVRRARALVRIGWAPAELARRLNVDHRRVNQLLNADRVTVGTARTIKALYEKLWNEDPSAHGVVDYSKTRAIARGEANGWAPPAAWDDDEIDDPTAEPDLGDRVLNSHERAELRREEIIHFAWHGDTPEQILDRLNNEVSISTVRAVIQEWRTGEKRQRPERVRPERQKELAA